MAVAKKPPLKKARVIDALNKARSMELYAIVQYMNQHYQLDMGNALCEFPAK
jgi:bacterioferritin